MAFDSHSSKSHLAKERFFRPDWTDPQRRDPGALWLDKNENCDPGLLDLTTKIVQQVAAEQRGIFSYPETGGLYQKLADSLGVSPRCLRLTPGSDGAIRTVFETFVRAGDSVLHTAPTFAMYSVYCKMFDAKAIALSYENTLEGPVLAFEKLVGELKLHKPRLFCLPNPDSPTGTVFAVSQLLEILRLCEEQNTLVLIDEAYFPFYEESCVPFVEKFKNLIVARTFAKAWGLAGFRIGYSVTNPEMNFYLHQVRPMYEVNTFACEVVDKMLDHEAAVVESAARMREGREFFSTQLRELGFKTLESHGNFLHVSFGDKESHIYAALTGKVLFRKSSSEGCLKNFSRFSVGPVSTMKKVLELIKPVV